MSFCPWYPSLSSSCLLLNALMMNFLLALADCAPTGWLRNWCIILVTCKLLIIGTPSLSGMTTTSSSSNHSTVADGSTHAHCGHDLTMQGSWSLCCEHHR